MKTLLSFFSQLFVFTLILILIFAIIGFVYMMKKIENFAKEVFYEIKQKQSIIQQAPQHDPQRRTFEYILQPGDNLITLQERFGVDYRVIKKVNKIDDENRLSVGAIILIPVLPEKQQPANVY
ncbi:MAG: LysM peptidoglycan-binding domain-containing protein [bacterium]|nr:LysM peptidoglycan-binding domain-containing protein [bacterium]